MPRLVTSLGLVQVLCIVCGYLALTMVMKVQGYPQIPEWNPLGHWSPLAVGLRTHGWMLLVLPALWAWYGTVAVRVDSGWRTEHAALVSGLVVLGVVLAAFLHAIVHPHGSLVSPAW